MKKYIMTFNEANNATKNNIIYTDNRYIVYKLDTFQEVKEIKNRNWAICYVESFYDRYKSNSDFFIYFENIKDVNRSFGAFVNKKNNTITNNFFYNGERCSEKEDDMVLAIIRDLK